MIMTDLQYASLVISLSTLGQTEIQGLDTEQLRNLAYLLEAARENVQRALAIAHEFVNAREEIENDVTGATRPMTPDERKAWERR